MLKQVEIFTDGSCLGNPGPGGYGAILRYQQREKTFSEGYRLTTNHRMEMMAAIVALEALKEPCTVVLSTDSRRMAQVESERQTQLLLQEIERTSAPTDPEVYGNVTIYGAELKGTEVGGAENTTGAASFNTRAGWGWSMTIVFPSPLKFANRARASTVGTFNKCAAFCVSLACAI